MFCVATTAMSDDTCDMDETLPNFDRNTLENILVCKANDIDDARKLEKLYTKLKAEVKARARAVMVYLETEQKLKDNDHRMYPQDFELLPWIYS